MANLKSSLARALALYVALLPFIALPAEARRTVASDPTVSEQGSPFRAEAPALALDSFNGFRSETITGRFYHDGHRHPGGIGVIESPWGERLELRFWMIHGGFVIEYDGGLTVRYLFDDDGVFQEMVAETADRVVRTEIGNRAELVYLGQRDIESLDMSAYLLVEESLSARHSAAFLDGLAQLDAPATASCATASIQCGACILGWVGTVAALAAACVSGGVLTFGAPCLAALLAHEAASFSCSATCINASQQCGWFEIPDGDDLPQGCNDPE